jgi:enoyl-CoA hydratase/carnithine racemase
VTEPGFSTLRVSVDGPVGRLVLDRPERLNALSRATLIELADAARWFDDQRTVTAVVVRGEGRSFSAGFDLGDFTTRPDDEADDGAELGRLMAEAVTAMRAVTVAAVHGHCVGGGLVLAAACDLRIAGRGARFSIPEVDLGIPLAWGGIPRLVRELGPAVTKELVLTCRPFDAEEARALRFLNRVVDDDEVVAAAEALAAELATKSPFTLTATKRHVNAVAEEAGSTAQSFRDAEVLAAALRDPASRAAGVAYLERRSRR